MNTLIGVSRLGFSSGAITAVGDNPFGEYVVKILGENCVDKSNVQVKRGYETASS